MANLRDIWPNEAHNFTPWLAKPESLDLLGRALGFDLEFIKDEAPVGPYWLDILAKEAGVSMAPRSWATGAEQKCTTREVIGQRKCPQQMFRRSVKETGWQRHWACE